MNYYRIAQSKYKKAIRITRLLKYVPGIKMIALCNTVAYYKAHEESDIDLFLIAEKGRVWTVRFFCALILSILRLRPRKLVLNGKSREYNKDKICISFILSSAHLNLESYKISADDPYLICWIKTLKPLYNEGDVYNQFIESNSFADASKYISNYKRRIKPCFVKPILDHLVTSWDERLYKYIQLKIMPMVLKQAASSWDSKVVISDNILKLHLNDRRLYYKNQNIG